MEERKEKGWVLGRSEWERVSVCGDVVRLYKCVQERVSVCGDVVRLYKCLQEKGIVCGDEVMLKCLVKSRKRG